MSATLTNTVPKVVVYLARTNKADQKDYVRVDRAAVVTPHALEHDPLEARSYSHR